MRKAILLGAALTLCTALAIAQDAPTAGSAGQAGSTASSSDQATPSSTGNTVQGCLSGSAGNYMLTDSTGVMYQLSGSDSDLSSNVNKEVEVTGTAGSKASASASNSPDSSTAGSTSAGSTGSSAGASAGASANANAAKTIDVTSVKKVADTCSSGK